MRPPGVVATAGLVLVACGSSYAPRHDRKMESKLELLEDAIAMQGAQVDAADAKVRSLELPLESTLEDIRDAEAKMHEAALSWASAGSEARAAAAAHDRAAASEREADRMFRLAVRTAMLASIRSTTCGGAMSTSKFRRLKGIDDPGLHVDHRIPRSLGGADHPLNYRVISAHENLTCGAGCIDEKFVDDPAGTTAGVLVSLLCP